MKALLVFLLALLPGLCQAREFTDDLGRHVTLPDHPRAVISTYDVDITLPMIELGHPPIASHGRIGPDGQPHLRGGKLLLGTDFSAGHIRFLGANTLDLEAVAALHPDLIITEIARPVPLAHLARIAPTVVLDASKGAPHIYRQLARILGAQARLAELEAGYARKIAKLRAIIGPDPPEFSVMMPLRGRISVYHSYRALGQVLRDAGLRAVPLMEAIPEGGRLTISPDRLPELSADLVFDPYRSDQGAGPAREIDNLERMLPGFCGFLDACRSGNYIFVPREIAISNSYAALDRLADMLAPALRAYRLRGTAGQKEIWHDRP